MKYITLGKNGRIDLGVLMRTRLLLQANSGGGKSWLIRRLAEQVFGKEQVIILDPEGEFPSLREKFDFVLAGKEGDTPTDVRSAALLAQRLLELHASAVCDLYEMKPSERHEWVKLFLNSMIDAPKKLWHPVLVVVDEAHLFMPEKGAGESTAKDAMIALATRGRKRGYCAAFATQRLGKLGKDGAAELHNVLIGMTMIDIDRKRAAEQLGVYGVDQRAFFDEVKFLPPGTFYAQGPAISIERIKVEVGAILTTHPESGSSKHATTPPPPPAKVKAMLPQLADLPQQAEQKAKTESELRQEIRTLKAEVAKAHREADAASTSDPQELSTLKKALMDARKNTTTLLASARKAITGTLKLTDDLTNACNITAKAQPEDSILRTIRVASTDNWRTPTFHCTQGTQTETVHLKSKPDPSTESNSEITRPEQRILDAVAWLNTVGVEAPEQTAVAFLAGYTAGGGAFNNPRGALRVKGYVEYVGDKIRLTESGRSIAHPPAAPLDSEELQRMVLERLPGPEAKVLKVLLSAYPNSISNEQCAGEAGYAPSGGAYNNPRGRLRSLGLIEYVGGGLKAREILFLE
jgi:hypothetical protein